MYDNYHPVQEKSPKTELLICTFLGFLGIHKLYEGKPDMFLLYLFTLGLFGFGWLTDTFLLIDVVLKDSNTKIPDTHNFDNPKNKKTIVHKLSLDNELIAKLKKTYIAFDTETTGLDPKKDRIVELCATVFEYGVVKEKFVTLVNPGIPISANATKNNGITNYMLKYATNEGKAFNDFMLFLKKYLDNYTVVCAYNSDFHISFLTNTLNRLGYCTDIFFIDLYSISKKYINGVKDYKLYTVAEHLDITSVSTSKSEKESILCGKILWYIINNLVGEQLNTSKEAPEPYYVNIVKLCEDELIVCAYIQKIILEHDLSIDLIYYCKNSSNYVLVYYAFTVLVKFRFLKKGKYIIVNQSLKTARYHLTEPCIITEGGSYYKRYYFNNVYELKDISDYLINKYNEAHSGFISNINYSSDYYKSIKHCLSLYTTISVSEMDALLETEKNNIETNTNKALHPNRKVLAKMSDVSLNPINDRVPLDEILNKNNWNKGFNEGYDYWAEGEYLRKSGDVKTAIKLFDKARYNGYCAGVLYESYSKAYHSLKDYDNEIDILSEGIRRLKNNKIGTSSLYIRRDNAIKLLLRKQNKSNKTTKSKPKKRYKPKGKPIYQMNDKKVILQRYESISEAVRATGINSKSIRDAANGIQKHAGGYVWQFADKPKNKHN